MRFWFDTEFLDTGREIKLISIGIAAEDGGLFYVELMGPETLRESGNQWVIDNVLPHLHQFPVDRHIAAREIVRFVGKSPEFWAYVADYDWVALSQLYGPLINRPASWPWTALDTYQLPDFKRYVVTPSHAHNALSDAVALKMSWEHWRRGWPDYPLPEHSSPTDEGSDES